MELVLQALCDSERLPIKSPYSGIQLFLLSLLISNYQA